MWGDYPGLYGWGLNVITSIYIRGREGDQTTEEESNLTSLTTEADIGVMRPWAKKFPQLPEAGRAKEGFSPQELPEEIGPAHTMIVAPCDSVQTSGLQNCKGIHFCCFKPLNLW